MSRRGAPSVRSVHHQRVLRQLGVAAQCFLDFFLGRGVRLPGVDLALESVGPGAVEVNLFVGALVDDFESVPGKARRGLALGSPSAGALACRCTTTKESES
jgi:hypothetical protein